MCLTASIRYGITWNIMERKVTHRKIRIAAQLEPDLVALVDAERKGRCSRATIVRMALLDRYQHRDQQKQEVA